MIDLEEALAPLVERAPAPPAVESVARRGRRHRRRRAVTLVAAIALVAVVAVGAIATVAGRDEPRLGTAPGDIEHVRVTLLDGSKLDISGPASLGLTDLPMSFNAEIAVPTGEAPLPLPVVAHSLSVERNRPAASGNIIGRYPTADGHELVVSSTTEGVDAAVQYDRWNLVVNWNDDPTDWRLWARGLKATEVPDGFLVFEPVGTGWRVGATDAPDVRIGDYAFFGPAHERCLNDVLIPGEKCNANATVLARALDPALTETLNDITVEYAPAAR